MKHEDVDVRLHLEQCNRTVSNKVLSISRDIRAWFREVSSAQDDGKDRFRGDLKRIIRVNA